MPQNPWLQNLPLRDNVTFGESWDEDLYRRVLHACALETDVQILTDGDMTK